MTREETRRIREAALEDDSLTANARLLLSFIIDWHHKEKGCVMHDSTLGDRLGMSERTVQRRRKELVCAGYLRVVHGAHRRELVPQVADSSDLPDVRNDEVHDTSDVSGDTGDDAPDTSDDKPHDTSDVDREIDNPEGASSCAREAEGRWDFLPDYRMRHLPEIKSEVGSPDYNPDVQSIAARYLNRSHDDLAGTVDWHLEQRSEDEVIAAYVIAGREADSPLEYADHIIRNGWKRSSGGDGASPRLPDDDKDVVHFGSTR